MREIERRRLALGYSRERLGAAGGISSATVRRVERGLVTPHPTTRAAMACALGCHVKDIFPESGMPDDGEGRSAGPDRIIVYVCPDCGAWHPDVARGHPFLSTCERDGHRQAGPITFTPEHG